MEMLTFNRSPSSSVACFWCCWYCWFKAKVSHSSFFFLVSAGQGSEGAVAHQGPRAHRCVSGSYICLLLLLLLLLYNSLFLYTFFVCFTQARSGRGRSRGKSLRAKCGISSEFEPFLSRCPSHDVSKVFILFHTILSCHICIVCIASRF